MVDNNDQLLFGKTILSPVRKSDINDISPHLEDLINHRDGRTASPKSKDDGDQDSLLDN